MGEIREAEVEFVMLNRRAPLMWFHLISSGAPARTGDPPHATVIVSQNQWPLKLPLFKWSLSYVAPILFFLCPISLFNSFYYLSVLRHPSIFVRINQWIFHLAALHCRSHRRGEEKRNRGEKGVKCEMWLQKRRLLTVLIWNPCRRSIISVPSGGLTECWQNCTAAFHQSARTHAVILPPTPRLLCGLRHHFSPPYPTLRSHSGGKCASHILTPCTTVHAASPPRCIKFYVCVLCYIERGYSLKIATRREQKSVKDT